MLRLGNYTMVDSHMYYNNNVIKIRYDVIKRGNYDQYKEGEIFDYYFNIFEMQENMKVRAGTPLDSLQNHKFAYFMYDKTF